MKLQLFSVVFMLCVSAIAQTNDSTNLKDIKEKKLKETTVVATRRVVKADNEKIAYDVSADPSSKTESVLDMLRKVPMVTVDGNDNIKIKGNSSFKVYVDGKPNTMMSADPSKILKNYPASAISKIEVITDPGAKYDGEGVQGILNIVTNKKMYTTGWSLTPMVKLGNEENHIGYNGMVKFNKLTLSSYYVQGKGEQYQTTQTNEYTFKENSLFGALKSSGSAKPTYNYQIGAIEGSYDFSEHDLLSVSASIFSLGAQYKGILGNTMYAVEGSQLYGYNQNLSSRMRNTNINAGADYQHTFKKAGEIITLSYRFTSNPSLNRSNSTYDNMHGEEYIPSKLENQKVRPDLDSYEHTAQFDYTIPFNKTSTLSTGLKYINRNNESNTKQWNSSSETPDQWIFNALQSIHYRHNSNIYAAYLEHSLNIGKFGLTTGLRYEIDDISVKYLDDKSTDFNKTINDLIPSVKLSYKPSEGKLWKLNFSSRIGRPSITMLSPYVKNDDGLNKSYGNPNLNSERGYNLTLGYGNFGQKFSINAELGGMTNNTGLTSYTFMDNANVINQTYANFLHERMAMMNLYINWMCTKTTILTLNTEGSYRYVAVKQINTRNDGWGFGGTLNFQQRLPWKLKVNGYMGFHTKSPELQGNSMSYSYHGMSLSRAFLKEDRLNITLSTNFFIHPNMTYKDHTDTDSYAFTQRYSRNAFNYSIGINWRFGELRAMVKKAKRSIQNNDTVAPKQDKNNSGIGNVGM